MRLNGLKLIVILVGVTAVAVALPGRAADPLAHPTQAELQRQAARCRELLRRSVVDFYLPHCLDAVNGGYLEDWRDGKFVPRGEKFLTLQARQLWFFSTLAVENIERARSLEMAWAGYAFLDRYFRDPRAGGYFSKTDDAGKPKDTRKHAYHNSFMLYGLVAYHRATRDREALRRAQDLFRILDQRAYDRVHGGYAEFFYADWRPVTDRSEAGYVGAIGTKTYNTHLHLLESMASLHRVWPEATVRARLEELVRINTLTVRHPNHPCNIDGWRPDWRMVDSPENLRASYGHDVECLWLTLDAVRTLGLSEVPFRGWAEALATYSVTHGYDATHGGFFYTGPLGAPAEDTKKEWWVQAEALVGMLEMYRLTGDPSYYRIFASTLDFVERHQVAADGGWWATRNADGSAHANNSRTSMWQGGYHNGRALLLSAQMLSNLKPRTN